uniref:Chromobox homolog 8a (Pc class homolog, Drosophila) n=1 Tax=Astyanax mexicanus TaxID=7994 RepID=A0A8B9GX41_ASTMX
MELSAVGERVFAAESIIKRRIRRGRMEYLQHLSGLYGSEEPTDDDRLSPEPLGVKEDGGESWSPCLRNMEKVIVTDITSNSVTVTIKESSTDKGFFREKR